MPHPTIISGLKQIAAGISEMNTAFPHRKFTMDGRLVGDVGEIVAELEYDITVDRISRKIHDGITSDGRDVQVKAGFGKTLTFGKIPEYYLGLKLSLDGAYEEIYNGPGRIIYEHFRHLSKFGEALRSVSNAKLKALSATVPEHQRIKKRAAERHNDQQS
ncbi:hypothetical protein SAMN05414139_05462 [Burkholderia sp. D7]|nr:hypothetical protein SAMN05414139_05462 [Burkholderia sp. D7]